MATVRKRGDQWQVQVRRRGFKAASRTFGLQRDAERWGTLKEREFDLLESQGMAGAIKCDLTLRQLLDRYRSTVIPAKRCVSREPYLLRALERSSFANSAAASVTVTDLKAYRDVRLKSVGPATVVRELGLLHHAYEVARKDWGFDGLQNPVKEVRKPKLPAGRARRLGANEERKLLETAQVSRNRLICPLMRFALETGMRLGEILSARSDDYNNIDRVLTLPMTKNGKPRTVPLSREAVAILAELPLQTGEAIFPTTPSAVKQAWRRLTDRAGITDLHFHDLRHEAVSRLFEKGLNLPEVMLISGHTDHRMLLRYTHLNARTLVEKLK